MRILVLDTIHGGKVLAEELCAREHEVDAVDVYRGAEFSAAKAGIREYDLVTAPVHLDPEYPLLKKAKYISHHEMTAQLITPPKIFIEVTGARGKTTTAFALAHLMEGSGVLHTSSGTYVYPEKKLLFKKSITPSSVIFAAKAAAEVHAEWLIAEESLGVSGSGMGILTDSGEYRIANGKKSALAEKRESLKRCKTVLVPEGVEAEENWHTTNSLVKVTGDLLTSKAGSFQNPLLKVPGYREALKTAAAAGVLLKLPIKKLASFEALPGRMHLSIIDDIPVMDNSASGTNADNTILAAELLQSLHPKPVTLVIGMEDHAVCEGFMETEIRRAVKTISPRHLILISGEDNTCIDISADATVATLAEAKRVAFSLAENSGTTLLFAVKSWR